MRERISGALQYACLGAGALLVSIVALARLDGDVGRKTAEQLEAVGKARAQSIQEALLGGGQVDPGRVFLIHADSQPPGESKIKLELSLK